ncbi:GNAT family N-acetyltransferase [Motiliproteus sp. MSK22-1]|uniref:GNAT family N-acetyltransferase n=1 Tax=Motiliproteus sp. MSK22-1 TaxID=1897630 RepID=UPI0009765387|nr:GNAT family N-acetyltransferase [Motiliproteus sp. MSK22-1]OMH33991.1 GNAT family N-acetyltransferase [Motiliproteus sp. MSK22-1]
MAQVHVQLITEDDFLAWSKLYQGYAAFYNVPMNDEILTTVWSWIHDTSQTFYGLIAKDEQGNALGIMHFRAMHSPLRGRMVGFLDDLFIAPDARGKPPAKGSNVVKALFDELKIQGEAKGWPLMRWITADNNYRARAVYDRLSTRTGWITYQMDLLQNGNQS